MSLLPEIFTGVAAALVTAWFAKSSDDKKNSLKFITDERRKWRDGIRKETETTVTLLRKLEAAKTLNLAFRECFCNPDYVELQKHIAFFEIRLNPFDEEDNAILDILRKFSPNPISAPDSKDIDEFQGRIALLLKHDWERSKTEVSSKWKVAFIIFSLIFTAIACSLKTTMPFGDTVGWKMIEVLHDKQILLLISFFLDLISVYYSLQLILNFLIPKCCNNPFTTEASSKFFKLFGIHLRIIKNHDSVTKENECCLAKVFSAIFVFVIILAFLLYLVALADSWNLCETMRCCVLTTSAITAAAIAITACVCCKICHKKTPFKTETEPKKESEQENPKSKSAE